jgi:DNA-binding transcriptional regulator YdaS (Cro superfamily)
MQVFQPMSLSHYLSKRGATARLASEMGVSHSTVLRWSQRRVPAWRVSELAKLTGIAARKLRPDLYGGKQNGK